MALCSNQNTPSFATIIGLLRFLGLNPPPWSKAVITAFTIILLLTPSFALSASPVQTIKVVMDDNHPPYIMRSEDNKLNGILSGKRKRIHAKISAMDWAEAQRRMLAGEFDVIDTIFQTPKRDLAYDFSKPYATIDVPLYFHTDISGIKIAEDIRGSIVGVKDGDTATEKVKAQGVVNLVRFNSYESIIAAARDGKIKVFLRCPSSCLVLPRADGDCRAL